MVEDRCTRRRQLRSVAAPFGEAGDDGRGQSELVGVVLLIGLVLLAVSILLVFGTAAVAEQEETAANSRAERSFDQLDTRASRVALGDSAVQEVDLGLVDSRGQMHATEDGWIRVTVEPEEEPAKTVSNTSLGTVYYEREETTVAYQGGGVFRTDGEGVTMLSRPEFHFNDKTLTLPVVSVNGDPGLTDRVRVTKNGTPVRTFPDASRNLTNRIQSGTVSITVQSDYYEAWGRYFETETDGVVTYDDAAEQVTVTFFGLPDVRQLDVGLIATSSTGQLVVNGKGSFPAYIDSYDSTEGNYTETQAANGNIRSAGSVDMGGNSLINGSVTAGKSVDVGNNAEVNGSVEYTTSSTIDGTVNGSVTQIDGVDSVPPIDSFVTAYADRIRDDAENDQTPYIVGNQLSIPDGTTAEIGPGDYYLHNMSVENDETLVLNTTNGDIRIAVRDWVSVAEGSKSGTIEVVGDGSVDLVVQSQDTVNVNIPGPESNRNVNFNVGQKGEVNVPGDNSDRLTVFGPETLKATIAASQSKPAKFVGIIFAPAGIDGPGYVYVKHGEVYGLVATGNLTAGTGGSVHFDRGIDNDIAAGATVSQIEYLHVVVHRAEVTST